MMASTLKGTSWDRGLYSCLEISEVRAVQCESPRVLSVLSSLLDSIVARNDRVGAAARQNSTRQKLTVFDGLRAPCISIQNYIQRIFKYANCSPSCFVVAYAYIDRFIHQQLDVPITSLNVHRLLITSVMVAAKFLDDSYYNNAYYAKVGGVTTLELNRLELEFLFNLNFRLHVTVGVFESYCSHLDKDVALVGGHKVERPFQHLCGFDEGSNEEKQQTQRVALHYAYSAV